MIAYNHYIKFLPEPNHLKSVDGTFSEVIILQGNILVAQVEKLSHKMTFFNNQGRDIVLYTDRPFMRTTTEQC